MMDFEKAVQWVKNHEADTAEEAAKALLALLGSAKREGIELLWTEAHKEWQTNPENDWIGQFQDAYMRVLVDASLSPNHPPEEGTPR